MCAGAGRQLGGLRLLPRGRLRAPGRDRLQHGSRPLGHGQQRLRRRHVHRRALQRFEGMGADRRHFRGRRRVVRGQVRMGLHEGAERLADGRFARRLLAPREGLVDELGTSLLQRLCSRAQVLAHLHRRRPHAHRGAHRVEPLHHAGTQRRLLAQRVQRRQVEPLRPARPPLLEVRGRRGAQAQGLLQPARHAEFGRLGPVDPFGDHLGQPLVDAAVVRVRRVGDEAHAHRAQGREVALARHRLGP